MSEEIMKNPSTSDNSFVLKWIKGYQLPKIKFNGNCLKQDSVSFFHKNVINSYINYELETCSRDLSKDFTLGNCLFGAVRLNQLRLLIQINVDIGVMILDSVYVYNFHGQVVVSLKKFLLLVLI